jgi:DUF971 family protein
MSEIGSKKGADPMAADAPHRTWPIELRLNRQKTELSVKFLDGLAADLSAELLRVRSPSAEVQGHSPSERRLVAGKRNVTIDKIEPVGNYAARLVFSDGLTSMSLP